MATNGTGLSSPIRRVGRNDVIRRASRIAIWTSLIMLLVILVASTVGLFLSCGWEVTESIVIEAPPESVFPLVGDLSRWPDWLPWPRDPTDSLYTLPTSADHAGATLEWQAEDLGPCAAVLDVVEAPRRVQYHLTVGSSGHVTTGSLVLAETPEGTRVSWTTRGQAGIRPFGGFYVGGVEHAVAAEMNQGLAALRSVAEGGR